MLSSFRALCHRGCVLACGAFIATAAPARDAATDHAQWSVEQMPGGRVRFADDRMEIESSGGTTVWWRTPLAAPIEISYRAEVVMAGGPHDRLSDLNCFWMAQDPTQAPGALPAGRSGKFSDYDNLRTYYVGYGGNENTTTRFRRYDGSGARPLLPEHDLRDAKFLLQPNHAYAIRIVVLSDQTEFWRDGERLFVFRDAAPLTSGYFAIRTVRSHLRISDFHLTPLATQPARETGATRVASP